MLCLKHQSMLYSWLCGWTDFDVRSPGSASMPAQIRVSYETLFKQKELTLEPKLVSTLSKIKRLVSVVSWNIKTASFKVFGWTGTNNFGCNTTVITQNLRLPPPPSPHISVFYKTRFLSNKPKLEPILVLTLKQRGKFWFLHSKFRSLSCFAK